MYIVFVADNNGLEPFCDVFPLYSDLWWQILSFLVVGVVSSAQLKRMAHCDMNSFFRS